jgi:hypothetical protein
MLSAFFARLLHLLRFGAAVLSVQLNLLPGDCRASAKHLISLIAILTVCAVISRFLVRS